MTLDVGCGLRVVLLYVQLEVDDWKCDSFKLSSGQLRLGMFKSPFELEFEFKFVPVRAVY